MTGRAAERRSGAPAALGRAAVVGGLLVALARGSAAQMIVPDENAVANALDGFGLFSLSKDVTGGSFRIRSGGPGVDDTRMSVFKVPWEADLEVGSGPGTLHLEAAAAILTAKDRLELDTPAGRSVLRQDWLSVAVLGGIGWTHPLGRGWSVRPGVAGTLGYTENDPTYNDAARVDIKPLVDGTFVDWEAWSATGVLSMTLLHARTLGPVELELESRYAWTRTTVFQASSDVQEGRDSGHLWVTRVDLEGPTRWTLRGAEVGWTSFLGYSSLPDAGVNLGFDEFFELGAGLELPRLGRVPPLELSAAWVAGPDLRGWSLGVSLAD